MEDDFQNINEPTAQEYIIKNRIQTSDEAIHGWYRFVLGYPPHLVREYLEELGADPDQDWVFDPFCGTATTPVEARIQGFCTMSVDANPISVLATRVKLSWDVDLSQVQDYLRDILGLAAECLHEYGLSAVPGGDYQLSFLSPLLPPRRTNISSQSSQFDPNQLLQSKVLIPTGFISDKPLLRVLALRFALEKLVIEQKPRDFLLLALANTIVNSAGNVGFGPEVYRLPPKLDVDVLGAFFETANKMVADLQSIIDKRSKPYPTAHFFTDDARNLISIDGYPSIGIVITSPPYPNEKDYTRSTRLESVLLGLVSSRKELRSLKSHLLRSNTRNVFVGDNDDIYIKDIPSVMHVADEIEETRIKLGKTSGFERLYHRVTRLYFGGMYRHLIALRRHLRPGARCAYVVGDQMSYFRIPIQTANLLADVAIKAGFDVEGIKLWRTRRSTKTGLNLNENVLIIKRPEQGE